MVNITTHIILALWLTSDINAVQGINVYNQPLNVHEDLIYGVF